MHPLSQTGFRLRNKVQHYEWGTTDDIPNIVGFEPTTQPCAEYWIGAHPHASSTICADSGDEMPLCEAIAQYPRQFLGAHHHTHGAQLPYLFKIIAIAHALSIQAHPSRTQAQTGFERERAAAIPIDAPERVYRDQNHKPELICALTPFWALCGFRPIDDIITALSHFAHHIFIKDLIADITHASSQSEERALRLLFHALIHMDDTRRDLLIEEARQWAMRVSNGAQESSSPSHELSAMSAEQLQGYWISVLDAQFRNDIGVLAPLYLNCVCLDPHQALFLPPQTLHSYLRGLGVEIMANSDNVIRGGLTSKHIDRDELLATLDYRTMLPASVSPTPRSSSETEKYYPQYAEEFQLSQLILDDQIWNIPIAEKNQAQIILCLEGDAELTITSANEKKNTEKKNTEKKSAGKKSDENTTERTRVRNGESMFIRASASNISLEGTGMFYRASCPAALPQSAP